MTTRSFLSVLPVLPLMALSAAALSTGCRSSKACCPPAPSVCQAPAPAQAPVYSMPDPNSATKADVNRVDDKVSGMALKIEEVNRKLDGLGQQPAAFPAPQPLAMPAPEPGPSLGAGDGEAQRFADTLRSRGVQADVRGGAVVVRLTDAFRSGSDNLKGDVALARTLQAVAEGLQVAPNARVQVVGHTDGTPIKRSPWPDNTALSRARAQTVARVLSENGVRTFIDVDGRGESEPLVSPEKSTGDKAKNRRVDIAVSF